ncbi:ATP-binding cassette, subfamily B (MDR/TAP), member 1 [Paragonimus westermani]|uniref:ATP-binding cassette, subfamily B (MDR/TAP), member 1 n=1 Tax=Paragonimus westermani TaxID=34504 RepID=A0A5J4P3Y6_9TREM|nr:ATP-binding cassette, subfamily B (MDR/TAP), member 1 [Paragonimus westermani]
MQFAQAHSKSVGSFRYADTRDIVSLVFGLILSVGVGVINPCNMLIFRDLVNTLVDKFDSAKAYRSVVWFAILGCIMFPASFAQASLLGTTSKRQLSRIRLLYFKSILRQDVPWFDRQSTGSLICKLSENAAQIETGIGTKLGEFIQNISGFIAGLVIAFTFKWKLTLVACAMLPLVVIAFALFGGLMRYYTTKELAAYSRAGSISGEVLAIIRTVVAFGGEKRELRRYANELDAAEKIFMNVIMGSIYLGSALPNFQYFMNAVASAREIYGTIERKPAIDKDNQGVQLSDFKGNVTFHNVTFTYPTRPDIPVLKNFSLNLESGKSIALVGPSGSGKSTIVHLLQRFYDATEGQIKLEGVDIRELDLKTLRAQLGCVQQEPILFEGTIAENIRMGKLDATIEEVEEAAILANAHNFILEQPQAYDTLIGERGGGMSGGQKQRIAIARALIRKPKLLLLDEATSALDTKSERVVQKALEQASSGRTAVIVAHRLTTIRNADLILVLNKGVIRESGTHDELITQNGLYAAMLRNQAKKVKKSSIRRILEMNRPELMYIVLGCISAVIAGAVQPSFAILYSEVYNIFPIILSSPTEADRRTSLVCGMMALLGFIRFFSMLAQGYFFGVSGERLTKRLRALYFECILKQEIGWFDQSTNQAGALTASLATQATQLKLISGSQLGIMMEAVVLAIVSLIIGFVYSWQLTLLFLGLFPLMVISGMFQFRNMAGKEKHKDDTAMMRVAQEAINNDRTVFTLTLEDYFYQKFHRVMQDDRKAVIRECLLFGLTYAMTQSLALFAFAAVFALGIHLIDRKVIDVLAVFRVFSVMNMGAQSLGRTASFGPEAKRASKSARTIFSTIDRQSQIPADEGMVPEDRFQGKVIFNHVYFRYPTRKELRILKNFSHTVEPGQTVALVGQSGCGKSTLLQLVQRFYDPSDHGPDSGVFFDQWNLRDLAPSWVRKQIGIVSQEPNLFDMTFEENIAYGDNSRDVSMEEIIEAARQANIHDFISTLPEGYQTMAGQRGSQLSGGQKQRIAIARALLRKPTLLLLDEATSALDNESERVVQQALDAAMGSRTSLVVAHRLSTVQEADLIVVLEGGHKIETGPPAALMVAKGAFYALHNAEQQIQL